MCVRDALTEQGVERRRVESGRVWMGAWKMIRGVQIVDRPFYGFHIASLAAHRSSSPQFLSHIACRHVAAEDVLLLVRCGCTSVAAERLLLAGFLPFRCEMTSRGRAP